VAAAAAAVVLMATIWTGREGQTIASPDTASELAAAPAATPTLDCAEHRALDWLAKAQESAGNWSAARWGGQPSYDVGLTALAAMTFLNSTPTTNGAENGDVLRRALDYLLTKQASGGCFGPLFDGALYNHGIATVALLEAFGRGQRSELRGPIDGAIRFLLAKQSPQGGWGYLGVAGDAPNTALTCWPLQALVVGRALGWTELDEPIDRGLAYLERVTDRRGRVGYRAVGDFPYGSRGSSSMGAFCVLLAREARSIPTEIAEQILAEGINANESRPGVRDLYGDFFLSSALTALPAERGDQWPRAACMTLAKQQVTDGDQRGSWEPKDQWSLVGGRIYSTATATLILQSERRTMALAKWVRGG
ncbi:MAG: prenyltransferase/squalene oxidase repeat-containing protein, partial [Planctomycetota bacterium]